VYLCTSPEENWPTQPSLVVLAFSNGLEIEIIVLPIGDDPCTSFVNLVGSRPANPEFTRLCCVQQASVSSRDTTLAIWGGTVFFTSIR